MVFAQQSTKRIVIVLAALCGLLLILNVATVIFFSQQKPNAAAISRQHPLVDLARNMLPQDAFLVNLQPLREQLKSAVYAEPTGTVAVYFESLNTGANIQINEEYRFYPASLVKLASAIAATKRVETGQWHMDARLVMLEADKDDRYGVLYKDPVGTSYSVKTLLYNLLVKSDNTAHNILMRNLEDTDLDQLRDAIGLSELFNAEGEVSAKEYSRMYRSLYTASYLSIEHSEFLLQLLTETEFSDFLRSGVPDDVLVSHKIGEDRAGDNYLDSGIVYIKDRPYLLTIMVKHHSREQAVAIMKKISETTYRYVYETQK